MGKILKSREVAELTGYNIETIRQLVRSGKLKARPRSKKFHYRFNFSDVEAFIKGKKRIAKKKDRSEIKTKFLTTKDVEELTGYSQGTISNFVRTGKLKAYRRSNKCPYRFTISDLEVFIKAQKKANKKRGRPTLCQGKMTGIEAFMEGKTPAARKKIREKKIEKRK
jgi:excisionase family DNA binding protein